MKPQTFFYGLLGGLFLWFVIAVLAFGIVSVARADTVVTYTWTAPTTGSPVVNYLVEISIGGGPFVASAMVASNTYSLAALPGNSYQIRVAGIDAQDRQGPYSDASDPYLDEGAPGQPGKPTIVEIILGILAGLGAVSVISLILGRIFGWWK